MSGKTSTYAALNNLSRTDSDIFWYGTTRPCVSLAATRPLPRCCHTDARNQDSLLASIWVSHPQASLVWLTIWNKIKNRFGANCANEQLANTYSTTADPTKTLCRQYNVVLYHSKIFTSVPYAGKENTKEVSPVCFSYFCLFMCRIKAIIRATSRLNSGGLVRGVPMTWCLVLCLGTHHTPLPGTGSAWKTSTSTVPLSLEIIVVLSAAGCGGMTIVHEVQRAGEEAAQKKLPYSFHNSSNHVLFFVFIFCCSSPCASV